MPQAIALKEPKNVLNSLDIKTRFIEAVLSSVKLKSGCVCVCVCVCACVCVCVCVCLCVIDLYGQDMSQIYLGLVL